jgi:hypothetical protein
MTNDISSKLIETIEMKRQELNELVVDLEFLDPILIAKSEELDKLIYDYEFQNDFLSRK